MSDRFFGNFSLPSFEASKQAHARVCVRVCARARVCVYVKTMVHVYVFIRESGERENDQSKTKKYLCFFVFFLIQPFLGGTALIKRYTIMYSYICCHAEFKHRVLSYVCIAQ